MIKVKYIRSILFGFAVLNLIITIGSADISGLWQLSGGFGADTMQLTQSGYNVFGTYNTPEGQGTINGYLYPGNIWRGWWADPLGDGHFIVTFSYDFNSFSGSWGYLGDDSGSGVLQGKKVVA